MKIKKYFGSFAVIALFFVLPGCWSVTEMFTPEVPAETPAAPARFSDSGLVAMPPRFWEAFGDEQLNELVAQALENNFTLRQAGDRLAQSEALLDQYGAGFWPSVSGSGSASRTRTVTEGSDGQTATSFANNYSLGLAASYELDLWGRVNANYRAADFDREARQRDVTTAAITVAGEITRTWLSLRDNATQRELLRAQLITRQQYLELVELRQRLESQTGVIDIMQQQSQVETKEGELIENERAAAVLRNRLAVLLGLPPDQLVVEVPPTLPPLPPLPATGFPAELLRRRPDVLAAEARLGAANERLRSAVANRFPAVSISSTLSASAPKVHDVLDNWFANLAANLAAPIIDGGSRRAAVEQRVAASEEALHGYSNTVLEALSEVEDAISNEMHQRELIENIGERLRLTKEIVARSAYRYRNGGLDYLRLLDAQIAQQTAEQQALAARYRELEYRLNLYRALAGDWREEEGN